jgi:NTE family protein
MAGPTRVALALGSGGARGYAHIGVIQVVEERGFEIVSIAGSSMGALVGGVHAAGHLEEYTTWVRGLRQLDVVRLLDPSLSAPGVIKAEKVVARVRELLSGARIEDLPIPFTAVATDLLSRREVWFQRGPVEVAIRASIAIPGVITPVMLNGRLLADGGVTNPVPISPTTSAGADATIAVSLAGDPTSVPESHPVLETAEARPMEEWTERFRAGASQLLDSEVVRSVLHRFGAGATTVEVAAGDDDGPAVASDEGFDPLPSGLGKFDMMNRSLEAMQSVLLRYRLAGYPPDVLIEVPRDAARSLDFHRAAEMIELGRTLTQEALDRAGLVAADAPA